MRRRSTLGLAFLLAVSTIVITAGPAFAAGDITGTVTSELGQAIPGICVEAHLSTDEGDIIGFDTTAADGTYTIAAIADGDYKLFFYDDVRSLCGDQFESYTPEVTAEWHHNVADFASATVVSIAGGDQVVDAVLTGLGVVEGTLSGGTDLSCMTANLYDTTDFTEVLATQSVASDNTYSFTGLITTPVYTFQFVSNDAGDCAGLASEWYGDVPVRLTNLDTFGDVADTFPVDAGSTLTIDPALEEPGTVSGMMISERTGDPIDGAPVRLYPLDRDNNVGRDWIQVTTIANGTFVVDDSDQLLVAGHYKLDAPGLPDAGGLTWGGEWWEDAAQGTAAVLVVAVGADTALPRSIDRHGPGVLTGTVTTDDGSAVPISGVTVTLYEAGGTMFVASETTAADGDYDFGEVNSGTFDLEFSAAGYDTEWFDNAADAARGSIVIADSTETSSPVTTADAALVPATASISGTVTTDDVSAVPILGVTVTLYTEAGSYVDNTTTAADGTYTFGTVGSGDYDLEFTATAYDTEWFDNAASAAAGSLTVGSGQAKIANAALLLSLLPGSITGTVTEDGSGVPVEGVTVTLYEAGGTMFVASETTDADGTYTFGTVGSGDYDLEFTATAYDTEWFDNAASAAAGSLTVGSGQAKIANAALLLSLLPGSITGTVTEDGSGVPVEGVTVTLYEAGGTMFVASETTDADGTYTFGTVGSGDYDLEFTATAYDTEWFDDAASAAAGSLTVESGQATIANAALLLSLLPGSITGTITDDSGPVSGVTVEAYVSGAVIGSATSAADGTYKISELVGDTYTVLANTGPAANPDTHFSAWYTFAPLFLTDDATDVVVGPGADVTGINIALQPLFVDVVVGSGFYADIVWVQESGITLGCGNDAYCASDTVTRAQMATFLVRALNLPAAAVSPFSDVSGVHAANIDAIADQGITLGCTLDGTLYCPDDPVTRAQMASFLVRALGYPISGEDYFTDDNGNTHEDNINTLRANNVMLGCNAGGTLYCPNDSVRRDHMAAFIHRALG